jgi:hypothetical protein
MEPHVTHVVQLKHLRTITALQMSNNSIVSDLTVLDHSFQLLNAPLSVELEMETFAIYVDRDKLSQAENALLLMQY